MTLSDFITNVNYALKGTDDSPPTAGDEDWNYWTTVANRKKNEMYDNVAQNWASAFAIRSIGTVAIGTTPSFNLAADFIAPAEQAYVLKTDGNKKYIDVVKPQERDIYCQQLYVSGRNPQTLTYNLDILTGDQTIGGTLYLPGYFRPADIDQTSTSAYIPVDDPNWLVMATAAQIAFNDITYEDKFDDLIGQANDLYRQMARKNRRPTRGTARVSQTKVKRIPGFRR